MYIFVCYYTYIVCTQCDGTSRAASWGFHQHVDRKNSGNRDPENGRSNWAIL